MLLSVLIPTLAERAVARAEHVARLYDQASPYPDVEILLLEDDRRVPYHRKLNLLVACAAGQYLSFVDDDDWVADDYIESIVAALRSEPGVDAVCFDTVWSLDGGPTTPVRFGPDLPVAGTPDTGFTRPIQHIQVVRADIARLVHYQRPDHGSDLRWATEVRDLQLINHVTEPRRRRPDQPMYHHRAVSDDRSGLWER